jgi:outer membrane receptor for monomeric catechols
MKKFLLSLTAGMFLLSAWGQEMNVTGTVVSDGGNPVKNIKLSILDFPASAKTDKNGRFILKKVRPDDTIVVQINKKSYAKFRVGKNDTLKLVLSERLHSISREGKEPLQAPLLQGTPNNSETRSTSVITGKMIERTNALTVVDAIKESIPGVHIQASESGGFHAIIRGGKSLNMPEYALVIVDGFETTLDFANSISVHDIASIEISKDGFDYGVKGANGVIIIKTKR